MKILNTICILLFSISLMGQYDNHNIGLKMGGAVSLEEEGIGSAFAISYQKHINKGIYGLVSYNQGNMTKGTDYPDRYLPDNMRQYSAVGLGIKKSLNLSYSDQLSLSFTGLYVTQRNVEWTLGNDTTGYYSLFGLEEKFSQKTDFSYLISLEYTHRFTDYFSLGLYTNYQAAPNLTNIGLTSLIHFNKPSDNTSKKSSSQANSKNALEFRFSVLGGDGTESVNQFDLEYNRKLSKRFSLYGKFSTAQAHTTKRSPLTILSTEAIEEFQQEYLADDNEGGNIWLTPIHNTSFGAGIKAAVNQDRKSVLSLGAGFVYYHADVVDLSSSGSELEFLNEGYRRFKSILPEVSAYYDYNFSDNFYVGVKSSLAFERFNIAVGLHTGVRF